ALAHFADRHAELAPPDSGERQQLRQAVGGDLAAWLDEAIRRRATEEAGRTDARVALCAPLGAAPEVPNGSALTSLLRTVAELFDPSRRPPRRPLQLPAAGDGRRPDAAGQRGRSAALATVAASVQ